MVVMMPGETLEDPQAKRGVPVPHHMNGCVTIPFLPEVLRASGGRAGGCGVPGGLHSEGQPGGPPHCEYGNYTSRTATDDDDITRYSCGVPGRPSSREIDFVSENFCVNGVEDGGARRSTGTLLTQRQEERLAGPDGEGAAREDDSRHTSCDTTLAVASSASFYTDTRTQSMASNCVVSEEGSRYVGEVHTALGETRTPGGEGTPPVLSHHRVLGGGNQAMPSGGTTRTTGNAAAERSTSPRVESSTSEASSGELSSSEHTWNSHRDNLYCPPPHKEDQYMTDELYRDEQDCMVQNPFDVNLAGSEFNIEYSDVHIGPKTVFDLSPAPLPNSIPGLDLTRTPAGDPGEPHRGEVSPASSGMLHINITPPVHPLAPELRSHSPLLQTHSAPDKSSTSPVTVTRPGARRLTQQPPLNIPLVTQTPLGMSPLTPQTPLGINPLEVPVTPPGTISIKGDGKVVVGTQIVINHPGYEKLHKRPLESEPPPPNTDLENLLTEVRDKLSTVYIRQTKTSFLPWLKGHQVIPMREFYTESRILAVDKQGRQTRQTVNLVRDLVHEEETRFLVEGEPGMGKTLLALKLAIDWANKKSLQEFKFVFLILLRDFKGSLEQYVREELLPTNFEEKFKKVWEYCKKHEEEVLFILDGYDELEKADEGEIQMLLGNRDFQNSKIVVTARPDVLNTIAQRTIVKGFSEAQMFEFITKYFKLVNEDECGRNLKRIIEKDYKYRKLAKRPLFCVLLCMLYGSDGVAKLPEKLSDMMFKIMLCLIKWNIKKVGNVDENTEDFPQEYEELFLSFGKLCLQALKTEKTRFSEREIKGIENSDKLLHLGFLSNDSENDVLGHKKFWKPVHKIFLEYLAGLYMAKHIERDKTDCRECREFSKVYRHEHVLKFVVGILGKRAHLALDGRKHQVFLQMRDQELLMLLRETEPTRENCRAVAKLLDRRNAIVYTSEMDFEGWSFILAQNFKKLKSLEIVWRIKSNNPDQESSFNEATPQLYTAFFDALRSNTSITKISIRATQDGEPFSDEKIELFFTHLQAILPKENLRELEIKELKMKVSHHLRKAFEGATCHMDKKALEALEILRLDMYMNDNDLEVLCRRLSRCAPNLKELQLTGLVHGPSGFDSLVDLLKKNKNLHRLCLSMNKAQLMSENGVFLSKSGMTPTDFHNDLVGMTRRATRESKDAFKRQGPEQRSQRASTMADPTRELSYLFQDPLNTGVKYPFEARGYYFITGEAKSQLPLPLCLSGQHKSMFHKLFSALPETSVQNLTLNYPCLYLSTHDLVCLGDAIRKARHLTTLKLHGLRKAEDYMPVLLGLGQSQSLTTVKLDSNNVSITDTAFQLACTALRHNTTLQALSLAHWEFNLQDKTLATIHFKDLLSSWKVDDLNLSNCIIDVSAGMSTALSLLPPILLPIHAPIQHWSSIRCLRLSEVKLKEQPSFLRRGHLLLPILRNCPNLTVLDLSASHTQATPLDDNAACKFFELLGTNFRKLKELTLGNWEFKFEHYEKTCAQIGNLVRSCSELKLLMLDKVSEVRSGLSLQLPCRTTFLHQLVNNLPRLSELSLCYYRIDDAELDRDTATRLGACFHNHWSSVTKFKLKFFGLSPGVETALHEALKKENVSVVVSQGFPLIFTVKRGYFLRT